jgi:cell division protein FtsX
VDVPLWDIGQRMPDGRLLTYAVRLIKVVLMALLAVLVTAGCSLFQDTPEEKFEKALDESAYSSVFLIVDATDAQRSVVRAWLERRPEVTEVDFWDRARSYEQAKQLWADDPEFLESIEVDTLPESFRPRVKDAAAVHGIRDGGAARELEQLPGVKKVVFPCTTVDECRKESAPAATPSR